VPELRDLMAQTSGAVALKSVTDAQSATLTFDGDGVLITHGLAEGAEQVDLLFDPEYTVGDCADPAGKAAARLLSPPLPDWREAAARFWETSRDTPGFPGRLVIVCCGEDEKTQETFGAGDDFYEIHGSAPVLAAVLSGQVDSFLIAVAGGLISVVGSAAHMSVMCGAHWKVRFGG
jgi:hypothetical protein